MMYLLILQFCVQVSLKYNSRAGMMPCGKLLKCRTWVPHTSGAHATSGPISLCLGSVHAFILAGAPRTRVSALHHALWKTAFSALGCLTPQSLLSRNSITLHDSDIPTFCLWPREGLWHRGIAATRCCFVLRSNHQTNPIIKRGPPPLTDFRVGGAGQGGFPACCRPSKDCVVC